MILLWVALGLDFALSFLLPQANILWNRTAIFYLGISLMLAGMAFRFYAMSVLGRFFTYDAPFIPAKRSSRQDHIGTSAILPTRAVSSLSPDLVWRSEIGLGFWRFFLVLGQAMAIEYLSKKPRWLRPWASLIGSICAGPGASSHLCFSPASVAHRASARPARSQFPPVSASQSYGFASKLRLRKL
jgi:hypothetical protein